VIQDNSAGIINHSSDCTPTVSVQHTITSLKYIKKTGEKGQLRIFREINAIFGQSGCGIFDENISSTDNASKNRKQMS
jgi:hypothetical protein